MKTHPNPVTLRRFLRLLCLLATFPVVAAFSASDDKLIAAVRAADDARVAATKTASRAGLDASYSDGLRYAHSNGKVDNKATQIQGVVDGVNRYVDFEYKERAFVPAGPGVVLMQGRVLVHMQNKTNGQKLTNDLNYLAVWREENGKWRFLAWQSCKNPEAPAATSSAKTSLNTK